MAADDDGELERLLKDYQVLEEQLRNMALQAEQFKAQKFEMERAKEELEKATGRVYISVGGVIVETEKAKALEEIGERSSLTETRLQSANKTFTEMKAREKQLNEKITRIYRQAQGMA